MCVARTRNLNLLLYMCPVAFVGIILAHTSITVDIYRLIPHVSLSIFIVCVCHCIH